MFNDFSLNNPIQSCLDYDNPRAMTAVADALVKHALSQPPSDSIKHLLIGLIPTLSTMEDIPESYGKFFISAEFQE